MDTEGDEMRCVQCGRDYVGMKKTNKFNCPHCGPLPSGDYSKDE